MGFFDFLKKKASPSVTFSCDFITGWCGHKDYKSALVSFDPANPGQIKINDDIYPADFPYVQDIGRSSDNKYDRISTVDWLFYVAPGQGDLLMKQLNICRRTRLEHSLATHPVIDFARDYLKPGDAVLEVSITCNVGGVSYDYGSDTRSVIKNLPVGSTLNLRYWPTSPSRDKQICVFTKAGEQIGYIGFDGEPTDPFAIEFQRQIIAGVPFTASVEEKGIVTDTDIWWCRISIPLKVPYPADSPTVYITHFGGSYHCKKGCCRADVEAPTYLTEQFGMKPCKRCYKST